MQFSSYSNFQKRPFSTHPENEFLMVSRSADWVAEYLDQNWELCAIARRDEDEVLFWVVGLPQHLELVYSGFTR